MKGFFTALSSTDCNINKISLWIDQIRNCLLLLVLTAAEAISEKSTVWLSWQNKLLKHNRLKNYKKILIKSVFLCNKFEIFPTFNLQFCHLINVVLSVVRPKTKTTWYTYHICVVTIPASYMYIVTCWVVHVGLSVCLCLGNTGLISHLPKLQ